MNTDDYEGHTPGPWEIVELPVPDPQWSVKLSAPEVGEFASIHGTLKWQPNKAELALIAAAPDLLRRLIKAEELIDELGNQEYPHYYWDGEEYRFRYEGSDEE